MRERLAQLEQADFDTFGEPAGFTPEADLSPEEWVAIRDEIWDKPWDDPSRFPDLMVEAMRVLGEVALRGDAWSRHAATQSLREMLYRAKVGVWRHEVPDLWPDPRESLIDQEPGLRHGPYIRRVETVVEDL
jgi:hypothetical protein